MRFRQSYNVKGAELPDSCQQTTPESTIIPPAQRSKLFPNRLCPENRSQDLANQTELRSRPSFIKSMLDASRVSTGLWSTPWFVVT
jgi:hypothetical protein